MSYDFVPTRCPSCGTEFARDPYYGTPCPNCGLHGVSNLDRKAANRAAVAAHNAAYEARLAARSEDGSASLIADVSPKARSDYARWLVRTGMTLEAATRVAASAAPDRIRTVLGAIATTSREPR